MHGLDNFKNSKVRLLQREARNRWYREIHIRKRGRGRKIISLSRICFCHKTEKTEKDKEQKKANILVWTTITVHKLEVKHEEEK